MANKLEPHWVIERFNATRHDRSSFDCGNAVLDDWLRMLAGQFEKRNLARTYVLIENGDVVVRGYYALSNHAIAYETLKKDQAKHLPKIDVPVALLGRLAVDRSVQKNGLGEYLLLDALCRVKNLAHEIGIRAVEVHAIDASARSFYKKYGFELLQDDPYHLFLPMQVISKLKLPNTSS